jgi:trehalose 6-phosphate synthase
MDDSVAILAERPLILLSNREPYEHVEEPGKGIAVRLPPGGLVSALDPTLRRTHGVWVAWGSGSADRLTADSHGRVPVPPPPEEPEYTLRRVWLDAADIEGYYLGFANSVLWPLCHLLLQHFSFRVDQWERYRVVNGCFADAVAEEALRLGGHPIVWIQDYHFALVADLLREKMVRHEVPDLFIHQFWHIPFPPAEMLNLLPYGVYQALLRGLVGNNLLEFHTERYADNFLDCVAKLLPDAAVDREARTVRYRGRTMAVGAFPISIDVARFESLAEAPDVAARAVELRERYAVKGRQLGVSVDRIDYTKGIPERLRALDLLWQESPELRERFTMLIVATPSRSELAPYHTLHAEILTQVNDINRRFATHTWTPLVVLTENADAPELAAFYRAADLCLVSSLQDGMNLVAKEFIASQVDERGVLVLSRFTGAAEEIEGALLVNPFNVDGYAAGIRHALEMPLAERRRRMHEMREQLRHATIFDWLNAITDRVAALMDVTPAARR